MTCQTYHFVGALGVVLAAVAPAVAQADFRSLGHVPGNEHEGLVTTALSADGTTAVGWFDVPNNDDHAFRWRADGGAIDLGMSGHDSHANGVSWDGSVVVGYDRGAGGPYNAFRWAADSGMVFLGDLAGGGVYAAAYGVSGDGLFVVGQSENNQDQEAFVWTAETGMVGMGELPWGGFAQWAKVTSADGTVVAGDTTPGGNAAFRWTAATGFVNLGDLPGGDDDPTHVHAMCPDGSVIVGVASGAEGLGGFRWSAQAGMVGLGLTPAGNFKSEAKAVSADGSIIVGAGDTGWLSRAIIWDADQGIRNLKLVLMTDYGVDLTGWTLDEATGISADGTVILGNGRDPCGDANAWIVRLGIEPQVCYADCSHGCSDVGVLNLFDFLCFVNEFNAGADYADCTGDGVLDLFDFLCFVNLFNAGCS